ncbi:hypothetical protein CASFOL_042381 [Castilleja foliolosa]|uniref:Uncharacterized protein n=1 Tax=Castilleja foliolosa TaxID=1961234 RepID=A0ABD3BAD3_9LAMI
MFSFDQMLNDKVILISLVCTCSNKLNYQEIGEGYRRTEKSGTLNLVHSDKRALGLHILWFTEGFINFFLPNVLYEYLFN